MLKHIKNKKILLGVLLFIPFTAFALQSYFFYAPTQSPPTNQPQGQSSPTPTGLMVYPTFPYFTALTDTNLPPVPNEWTTGDNPRYTIQFPPDWTPEITEVEGGGTHVFLHPPSSNNRFFPRIDIEEAPIDPSVNLEKRMEQLTGLSPDNLSTTKTVFRSVETTQISEVLPITDTKGNPVHKTFLFFEKDNHSYALSIAYFDDENKEKNLLVLLQILNSMTIK